MNGGNELQQARCPECDELLGSFFEKHADNCGWFLEHLRSIGNSVPDYGSELDNSVPQGEAGPTKPPDSAPSSTTPR